MFCINVLYKDLFVVKWLEINVFIKYRKNILIYFGFIFIILFFLKLYLNI